MAGINQISKEDPNLLEIMSLVKNNVMSNINCHNIGKIIEFDAATQTCTVELQQIKQFNDKFYTPVPITEVPLIIAGAGGGHITMPNPVGTICLLLFLDRNIDNFLATGEQYVPETSRMHDFTDCVALTTFKTLANPLEDYDERAISIFNEEITEEIKNNSYIKVYGDNVLIKTQTTTDEGTAEATISVNDKIGISNSKQNLASLIGAFLTACENIAVNPETGIILDSSKQAFTNLKTQFEELLQ